jgi:hypothetical protein
MIVNIVESVNNVLIMKSGKAKFLKGKRDLEYKVALEYCLN